MPGAVVGFFTDVPLEDHIQVIETDLMGTIYGSYAAIKIFLRQEAGTLINIASMIGKIPAPYYASYAAAKHGVVGLSAALRQELSAQRIKTIHVATVMPMAMNTPFFSHAANYTGHQAVPIPPMDDAGKVIDAIVDLVVHPRNEEVPVGSGSGANLLMHNTAPSMSENVMAELTHQVQMKDAPVAAQTNGTLRAPDLETNGKSKKNGGDFAGSRGIRDPRLAN
ncbi:MAG: SDR family NAD(P)-dependent oxidoreductase [Cyanobacteria bacterium SZAS LIN-3]|nr:SDR family NAD(P)-dependent oxidoreductase [Cyanobacteria bacterium SZAS LIN-3]MBS2008992.1 SDR family NAD(P)-dependent oxidoreductase [Cyanobacteria bacterium SZAS TMP-1]